MDGPTPAAMRFDRAWAALEQHRDRVASLHLRDLFAGDPGRFRRFSLTHEDLLLDYSKQRITVETMTLLHELARAADLSGWVDRMFSGDRINNTEDRAAFHVSLRNRSTVPMRIDGRDVMPDVREMLARMRVFADRIRAGEWVAYRDLRLRALAEAPLAFGTTLAEARERAYAGVALISLPGSHHRTDIAARAAGQ